MNWIELKALNYLYKNESVKLNETLTTSKEISYLINSLRAIEKDHKYLRALDRYASIYEKDYLAKYMKYENFLLENSLLKHQTKHEEADIKILMKIWDMSGDGTLKELRQQIIDEDISLRNISFMFFKNEKYLDNRSSLVDAIKQILDVEYFSNEKDQQYIIKLECHNPVGIVLCENLDFLTKPNKPRRHGIELWHVGGKNVGKLEYSQTRGLPIYYSCDWDYDGLFIIYPLVKEKIPTVQLLIPNGPAKGINETEHPSKWPLKLNFERLLLDKQSIKMINELQQKDQWIIEESNDLLKMLSCVGIISI
jgi:hypothetical protein